MAKCIEVKLEQLYQLLDRIGHQELEKDDWSLVGALVSDFITRTEARQKRIIDKLNNTDDGNQEVTPSKDDTENGESNVDSENRTDDTSSSPNDDARQEPTVTGAADSPDQPDSKPTNNPKKGHGRNGVGAYTNAKHFFHKLALGIIGSLCEVCRINKMQRYREKVIVRVLGQPLFDVELHHYEQAYCRNCGHIIRAPGPTTVLEGIGSSYVFYDWSACAMLILMHYSSQSPFKRLESLHKGWGIPLADSNQWNVVDKSDDLLLPLYRCLEIRGMQQAVNMRIDDTGAKVIELQREIKAEIAELKRAGKSTRDVRTGINTTCVYLELKGKVKVILFLTGRHHAGEVLDQLLVHRQSSQEKLPKASDGASKNRDHSHADKLDEGTCNTHAYLKFRGVKKNYPNEYDFVAEIYQEIYENDAKTKALDMTPEERMLYHREHSKPLMEKLYSWCADKIKNKLVEPNSQLWEPVSFIVNQWEWLTMFYKVPGVPLDTNLCEQKLIMIVRYLAVSFNYHNVNGATVGDHFMSLIATASANDVEPAAYLEHCLRNHEDLKKRPEYYLPWVYKERLAKGECPSGFPNRLDSG